MPAFFTRFISCLFSLKNMQRPYFKGEGGKLFMAALAVGTASIITQILLIREFLNIFQGNELVIGIILGNWLLITAFGSHLGKKPKKAGIASYLLLALSVTPAAAIMTARMLLPLMLPSGAMASPVFVLLASILVLLPYCLISGMLFTLISREWKKGAGKHAVSRTYLADTIGSVLGGILFTFLLLELFKPLQTSAILGIALAISSYLVAGKLKLSHIALAALFVLLFIINPYLQTSKQLFPKQKLVLQEESPYGRIAVAKRSSQTTVYENRIPLFYSPGVEDREETAHYAMLQRPSAKRVLLLGGAGKGTASEVRKYHDVEQIDYLEHDRSIIKAARLFMPGFSLSEQNVVIDDPRRFVKKHKQKYDVVLLDFPVPSSIALNRYFTKEFFAETKRVLSPRGVLSVPTIPSANYYSSEAEEFLGATYKTLSAVFQNVIALPGRRVYFLASDGQLNGNIPGLLRNASIAGENQYFIPEFIDSELSSERKSHLQQAITNGMEKSPVNSDFKPVAFEHALKYWLSHFQENYSLYLFIMAVALLLYLKTLNPKSFALFTSGFAGSTGELIILVAYQAVYGELYKMTGLLVSVFMLGLAAGAACQKVRKKRNSAIVVLEMLIAFSMLALPFFSRRAYSLDSGILIHLYFSALSFVLAFIMGFEFSLIATLREQETKAGHAAAETYSADLVGSAAGSLLAATLLLPAIGIAGTALTAGFLNIISGLLLTVSFHKK
ncbi:hypothetical protein D6764_00815 [Candidatus Woesearchaeota archaeon]|nr:MAG: hypothetical protein D6764_00815 [Candidatus Woesearchaeota archaeon]